MSAEYHISPQDYELLSAYLDGELDDVARISIEQRLSTDDFLQRELDALQSTVNLINQLQPMKAPRNFTLTTEMVTPSNVIALQPRRRMRTEYLSLVASVLLMLFGVIFMLSEIQGVPSSPTAGPFEAVQSETGLDKIDAPEVANAPDESNSTQSQADNRNEDDNIPPSEPVDDITDDGSLADVEGSDAEMALQSVVGESATGDDEMQNQQPAPPVSDVLEDSAEESSIDSFAFDSTETASDGDMSDELQLFEAESSEEEPQAMAGASFAEPNAASSTPLSDVDTITTADADETVGNDDASRDREDITQEEDTNPEGRMLAQTTEIPPSPQTIETEPQANLNNLAIGVLFFMAGGLLLFISIMLIRRNRS